MKFRPIPILIFLFFIHTLLSFVSAQPALAKKDLPKVAVWDLTPGDIKPAYAQDLTSILVSEISQMGKYEVYSQENVRTLAGWTAERMQLGCTDTKCLTALGQMDIAKLISGRVGKIGNRYSLSLSLFDTQNTKSERSISEFCRSENELIELVQVAVRKLLNLEVPSFSVEEKGIPSNMWEYPIRIGDSRVRVHELLGTASRSTDQLEEYVTSGVTVWFDEVGRVTKLNFAGQACAIYASASFDPIVSTHKIVFGLSAQMDEAAFRRILGDPTGENPERSSKVRELQCIWKKNGYVVEALFVVAERSHGGKIFPKGSLIWFEVSRGL